MGAVTALAGVTLEGTPVKVRGEAATAAVSIPLRLAPAIGGARQVTASLLPIERAALLRRLAYALPTSAASVSFVSLYLPVPTKRREPNV